jgi:hypothetical protein
MTPPRPPSTKVHRRRSVNRHLVPQLLLLSFLLQNSFAIGQIVNPGFDDGVVVPRPPFFNDVESAPALPGWTAYQGDTPLTYLIYDTLALDSPWVSIHDNLSYNDFRPIDGKYSVYVQGGDIPGGSASITQPILIPAASRSILFPGRHVQGLELSFAGQPLNYFEVGSGPGYVHYGADITQFAGQSGLLRFSASYQNGGLIDYVLLSPQVVPEPSAVVLLIGGGAAILFLRRNRF